MNVSVVLPDHLDLDEQELKWRLAAKMYEDKELTLRQGARMVGVTLEEFMYGIGRFGVSVFQYSADDLAKELDSLG